MWNRKDYSRKLIGMTLIAVLIGLYFLNGGKSLWMILGGFLILEHYFIWDRWDAYDFLLGHEYWGLYLITGVYLFNSMWLFAMLTVGGFFFGATYNKFNPFRGFVSTIKEVFHG